MPIFGRNSVNYSSLYFPNDRYLEPVISNTGLYYAPDHNGITIYNTQTAMFPIYIGNGWVVFLGGNNYLYKKNAYEDDPSSATALTSSGYGTGDMCFIGNNEIVFRSTDGYLYRKSVNDTDNAFRLTSNTLASYANPIYSGLGYVLYWASDGVWRKNCYEGYGSGNGIRLTSYSQVGRGRMSLIGSDEFVYASYDTGNSRNVIWLKNYYQDYTQGQGRYITDAALTSPVDPAYAGQGKILFHENNIGPRIRLYDHNNIQNGASITTGYSSFTNSGLIPIGNNTIVYADFTTSFLRMKSLVTQETSNPGINISTDPCYWPVYIGNNTVVCSRISPNFYLTRKKIL